MVNAQTPAAIARLQADALTAVEAASAEWLAAQNEADVRRQQLDDAIAAAVESGVPARVVAESAGFSPQNISLIVAKATGRPLPPSIEARRARPSLVEAAGRQLAPDAKPRRDGTRWERWEDEAIADLYIEQGPNGGNTARREALAARMERTPASVLMRLGNLRAIVEGKGLSGYAKQTLEVAKAKGLV
jgi:hypothetical protein